MIGISEGKYPFYELLNIRTKIGQPCLKDCPIFLTLFIGIVHYLYGFFKR